jgi:hypothetical protein
MACSKVEMSFCAELQYCSLQTDFVKFVSALPLPSGLVMIDE